MGIVSSPEVLIMMNKRLKLIIASIVVVLFVAQGCAGRSAHPVTVVQSGDAKKTCKALRKETQQILRRIHKMVPYIKKKDKKTVLKMVTGALIIIPWFFVDMKDAEKVEANALRERYNYLSTLVGERNCRFKAPRLKRFYFHHEGYRKKT
jgi:hypothetical protein|tara:strand:- start:582 stop:1031 length:450 start_codon:yes stop_codon:yes gene_type:complete